MVTQRTMAIGSLLCVMGLGGIMMLTNPSPSTYEDYAIEEITKRLENECNNAGNGLGILLQGTCRSVINAFTPQARALIQANTSRSNFILFSIYKTNLDVPALKFKAEVESVGVFNSFYTYKVP